MGKNVESSLQMSYRPTHTAAAVYCYLPIGGNLQIAAPLCPPEWLSVFSCITSGCQLQWAMGPNIGEHLATGDKVKRARARCNKEMVAERLSLVDRRHSNLHPTTLSCVRDPHPHPNERTML